MYFDVHHLPPGFHHWNCALRPDLRTGRKGQCKAGTIMIPKSEFLLLTTGRDIASHGKGKANAILEAVS